MRRWRHRLSRYLYWRPHRSHANIPPRPRDPVTTVFGNPLTTASTETVHYNNIKSREKQIFRAVAFQWIESYKRTYTVFYRYNIKVLCNIALWMLKHRACVAVNPLGLRSSSSGHQRAVLGWSREEQKYKFSVKARGSFSLITCALSSSYTTLYSLVLSLSNFIRTFSLEKFCKHYFLDFLERVHILAIKSNALVGKSIIKTHEKQHELDKIKVEF